jgi:hypothetical protein
VSSSAGAANFAALIAFKLLFLKLTKAEKAEE